MDELQEPLNSASIVRNQHTFKRKKQALSVTDTILSLVLVSPLTIGCWRGTWELVNCYTNLFPAGLTFLFGNVAYVILIAGKYEISELVTTKSKTLECALKRLHTYVFMWIGICIWNRGWQLYNLACEIKVLDTQELDGDDIPYSIIGSFVFCYTCLGCLRSTRSALNVPFVIVLDTWNAYFDFPTRFKKTTMDNTLLLISSLLTICLTQEIAFPGIDENEKPGEEPHRLMDKRIPLMIPGACPPNQLLYPGDQKHDWICDCGPGFLYYPPKDGCFKAYIQGPCSTHEYLVLPKNEVIPECIRNPCRKDGLVRYNGKCYELGKSGEPCPPANEGGGVFGINATTFELQCLEGGDTLSLINFPPNCPKGSRRSASRCRPEY